MVCDLAFGLETLVLGGIMPVIPIIVPMQNKVPCIIIVGIPIAMLLFYLFTR